MTFEDVLALARSGFTAQQIAAFGKAEPSQEEPKQEPAQEEPKQEPAAGSWEQVEKQIAAMQLQLNKAMLAGASQNGKPAETADDIIANIINPPIKKEA